VNVALNGFPESWEPFVQGICAREKLPPFDRLWINCIQEEARIELRNKQRGSDDENQALATHARKGKEKVQQRERHLQSSGRKTLARSSALLVISKVTMLHNVHNGRKGREATNIIGKGG
jgi:hypothetical protein